ncbi:MAG: hypothetical protein B6229_07275 [Spirochaetaceae bacterium 4572_7]|nr:MAG: hypothetical protein B6229_07275 [Spirochaetaceae bacterium 4572_7]
MIFTLSLTFQSQVRKLKSIDTNINNNINHQPKASNLPERINFSPNKLIANSGHSTTNRAHKLKANIVKYVYINHLNNHIFLISFFATISATNGNINHIIGQITIPLIFIKLK